MSKHCIDCGAEVSNRPETKRCCRCHMKHNWATGVMSRPRPPWSDDRKRIFGKHVKEAWSKGSYKEKVQEWHNQSIGKRTNINSRPMIKVENHPNMDSKGRVRESRLIMESLLGRYLAHEEIVHHLNGDQTDNRPANLALCNKAWHQSYHRWLRDGKEARVLLYGVA